MSAAARPRSYDEMVAAKNLIFPPITFQKGKDFKPRPSDVIVTPWSKGGTTWLQQIAHGLRSDGDMSFDDISEVSPWIEVADALGIDLDADQGWEPRIFKSHYSWISVPKGCRYIVAFREPYSTMVSYYRFYEGWMFEPGTVTIDEYVAPFIRRDGGKDYWTHMESWWGKRGSSDTLLLSYELMQDDLVGTVRRVAEFLEMDADARLIDLVAHQSTREFMLANVDKFNDKLHRERSEAVNALPPGSGSTKVTDGTYDPSRYEMSEETREGMERNWAETMLATHGLASYEELTEQFRE